MAVVRGAREGATSIPDDRDEERREVFLTTVRGRPIRAS
jgi:hypothetical protein